MRAKISSMIIISILILSTERAQQNTPSITFNQKNTLVKDGKTIRLIPGWKWMG